jgi:sterol desaturase/sphingolipid hydroxylase (fatty acid hydroxylase superfamily)
MNAHLLRYALQLFSQVVPLAVWLVLLVCIFVPLEQLFALHPSKIWRKQAGVDLAWYFINNLFPVAIMAVPLLMLARALRNADPGGLYSAVAVWPLWLKLSVVLVVSDIGSYWAHRAEHAFPFLWRFHSIHHSAEQLDWLVNTRAHPFDLVFTKMAGLVPVYLLGLARTTGSGLDPVVAWLMIIGALWTFFIHANIRIRLGPLEWLVSTPAFHHWHHANDEHRDHNYAALFPFIDKVFGTSWLPKYWPPVYGIDATVSPTLAGQLLDPLTPRASLDGRGGSAVESLPARQESLR